MATAPNAKSVESVASFVAWLFDNGTLWNGSQGRLLQEAGRCKDKPESHLESRHSHEALAIAHRLMHDPEYYDVG